MKKSDALIGGVSLLILLIGVVVFVLIQTGAFEYRNMQGPVGVTTETPTTSPSGRIIINPSRIPPTPPTPPPTAALGAAIMSAEKGVLVQMVLPDSTAAVAGLQEGDVIGSIDNAQTPTAPALLDVMRAHKVGDNVTLKILREGKEMELKVTLMARSQVRPPQRRSPSTRP